MNVHDPKFAADSDLAQVIYGDGEFKVVRGGRYVRCAVSGVRIPLDALRYWNPVVQEAYAGPKEALARWQELQGKGG
jgi:hypothetical protein